MRSFVIHTYNAHPKTITKRNENDRTTKTNTRDHHRLGEYLTRDIHPSLVGPCFRDESRAPVDVADAKRPTTVPSFCWTPCCDHPATSPCYPAYPSTAPWSFPCRISGSGSGDTRCCCHCCCLSAAWDTVLGTWEAVEAEATASWASRRGSLDSFARMSDDDYEASWSSKDCCRCGWRRSRWLGLRWCRPSLCRAANSRRAASPGGASCAPSHHQCR